MDYQGYKLIDKIILVCRDKAEHEESQSYWHHYKNSYQAYLVDPSNKKQLESARYWAKWTEYGPSYKNDEGKWVRDYEIEHPPVEFEFENNGFELELLDCAGGSSQGGKLSFWNCLVTKDNNKFVIGINSDMLLDLLKNATFVKGVCQDDLLFVTNNGKVGMCAEGSEVHRAAIKDMELKAESKKNAVSKFSFGDIVTTPTLREVYLGTITKYYSFDPGSNNQYNYSHMYYRDCIITKLAKPITYHVFDSIYGEKTKVSDFLNDYGTSRWYSYPDIKKTCPKRAIEGKLEVDCSEEYFKEELIKKIYDYKAFENYATNSYIRPEDRILYYFLSKEEFGLGFEPFELPEDIMYKIRAAGIKYVDETKN